MVKMKLLNLNGNKFMGPDNIHPHMLKSLADTISKPLAIIFNKSMVIGTTPEQWAEAIITAIHKGEGISWITIDR